MNLLLRDKIPFLIQIIRHSCDACHSRSESRHACDACHSCSESRHSCERRNPASGRGRSPTSIRHVLRNCSSCLRKQASSIYRHCLLALMIFSFSFPAFSVPVIQAKDLKISPGNFISGSIFNEATQSAVTNSSAGVLRCAIGVTGKGVPINCTSNICTDRLTATNTIPDISAFDNHLCVDPNLYHPKIHDIGNNPRSQVCPTSGYTVDVNIATSGHADQYIRAMSYRYAGQWIKNYTPKCWVGLPGGDAECPENKAINDHKVLLTTLPATPTASQKRTHCCNNAIGGPGNPRFETFTQDPSGVSSSRYEQSINTLAACGVELHTELNCGSFCNNPLDGGSQCAGTQPHNNWKASNFCMCEPSGRQCGTCMACNGSPSPTYACNPKSTSAGDNTYGCVGPCKLCSGGTCGDVTNGQQGGCGECHVCQGGVCAGTSGGSCSGGRCGGVCSSGTCVSIPPPTCGVCENEINCVCVLDLNCQVPCGPCETRQQGVCVSSCTGSDICCGGTCQPGPCGCSCQGVTCGSCSTCDPNSNCQCGPSTTCPPGETLDLNTCGCVPGGCGTDDNVCRNAGTGTHCCQGNCITPNCTQPRNILNRTSCQCECGSVQTCTGGQTWNSTTCQCEGGGSCGGNTCTSSQVCCGVAPNRTCQNSVTDSSCGLCREASDNQCRCENTPGADCGACGTCLNNGTCDEPVNCTCTPTTCKECDSNNNLVNASNGTSCGTCGTCSNGSCTGDLNCCGNTQCSSGQVCCGGSCQAPVTQSACTSNERPSSDECSCVPIICNCGNWSTWTPAATACGSVTQSRSRTCNPSGCNPLTSETQTVSGGPCGVCQTCVNGTCQGCPSGQVCCGAGANRSCQTPVTDSNCGLPCRRASTNGCRCENNNGASCGTCGTCNNGSCNDGTPSCNYHSWNCGNWSACSGCTQTRTCSRNADPVCGGSCTEPTSQTETNYCGGPCGTCGTCNNGSCNEPTGCGACGCSNGACNSQPPEPQCLPGEISTYRLIRCLWEGGCQSCTADLANCKDCDSQGREVSVPNNTLCGTPNSCNTCQNGACTPPSQTCPQGQIWDGGQCRCVGTCIPTTCQECNSQGQLVNRSNSTLCGTCGACNNGSCQTAIERAPSGPGTCADSGFVYGVFPSGDGVCCGCGNSNCNSSPGVSLCQCN